MNQEGLAQPVATGQARADGLVHAGLVQRYQLRRRDGADRVAHHPAKEVAHKSASLAAWRLGTRAS